MGRHSRTSKQSSVKGFAKALLYSGIVSVLSFGLGSMVIAPNIASASMSPQTIQHSSYSRYGYGTNLDSAESRNQQESELRSGKRTHKNTERNKRNTGRQEKSPQAESQYVSDVVGQQTEPQPSKKTERKQTTDTVLENHPTSRTCWGYNNSDCQWAVDLGGLVRSETHGGWVTFNGHNSTESWILNQRVGDIVMIDGQRYLLTNRWTIYPNVSYSDADFGGATTFLQTCDTWDKGMTLFSLEAI